MSRRGDVGRAGVQQTLPEAALGQACSPGTPRSRRHHQDDVSSVLTPSAGRTGHAHPSLQWPAAPTRQRPCRPGCSGAPLPRAAGQPGTRVLALLSGPGGLCCPSADRPCPRVTGHGHPPSQGDKKLWFESVARAAASVNSAPNCALPPSPPLPSARRPDWLPYSVLPAGNEAASSRMSPWRLARGWLGGDFPTNSTLGFQGGRSNDGLLRSMKQPRSAPLRGGCRGLGSQPAGGPLARQTSPGMSMERSPPWKVSPGP